MKLSDFEFFCVTSMSTLDLHEPLFIYLQEKVFWAVFLRLKRQTKVSFGDIHLRTTLGDQKFVPENANSEKPRKVHSFERFIFGKIVFRTNIIQFFWEYQDVFPHEII